ncbi:MAG TPA: FAD-dependent oxidoreductase [Hyphomicrobiales bacterium]|nr:FAD-dependent oxidoreductase [Hyphomicrobiales bacterium]
MDKPKGPDFGAGVALAELADGQMLAGHVGDSAVLLARRGDELFALDAHCTHYGAPLASGLIVGDTLRCPWHHACFSLRTGEALRAPALDSLASWRVERQGETIFVREKAPPLSRPAIAKGAAPDAVVIVGGGAAGNAAAEMLRREGYDGRITMLSADKDLPCDRPNLSKGFLAGKADDGANTLRSAEFYRDHGIDVRLGTRVAAIDTGARQVGLADGGREPYGALLLATGAEPVRLDIPGAGLLHVHYLRTHADARALVAAAAAAKRAVVIGASFIGLEVAASLRTRGLEVAVVAPDKVLMERVFGAEVGNLVKSVHESNGVVFHLGTTATAIESGAVALADGTRLDADLVVIGIGVRPATALAEQAGLATDRGVTVDAFLETSVPGVFAAGDIARWPDRLTGERLRIEHWIVAERQGQAAAKNILGRSERFDVEVPFFWTNQFNFGLRYVGHAPQWDRAEIDGDLADRRAVVTYRRGGRRLAVATIRRDLDALRAEAEMEAEIATA